MSFSEAPSEFFLNPDFLKIKVYGLLWTDDFLTLGSGTTFLVTFFFFFFPISPLVHLLRHVTHSFVNTYPGAFPF